MTETIIALVPEYGLYLLFGVVLGACFALPLPASVLVLTSGSFAATEQLSLIAVLLVTYLAYVIGDQGAFGIANRLGPKVVDRFRASEKVGPVIDRSQEMLEARGSVAVFLSHTVLSPTAPYVTYLSGAGGLSWHKFTLAAMPGAALWVGFYVGAGYLFAGQIESVIETLSHYMGLILAGVLALACLVILRRRWRAFQAAEMERL